MKDQVLVMARNDVLNIKNLSNHFELFVFLYRPLAGVHTRTKMMSPVKSQLIWGARSTELHKNIVNAQTTCKNIN